MYAPCFGLRIYLISVQAASAVRVNLQALLEEFGKWSALQTIHSKPCCLQHMLTNSPAFNFELEILTISYMPTCMTMTPAHHGLWLNLRHVGQGQGGNACRAAGTGNIFFHGLQGSASRKRAHPRMPGSCIGFDVVCQSVWPQQSDHMRVNWGLLGFLQSAEHGGAFKGAAFWQYIHSNQASLINLSLSRVCCRHPRSAMVNVIRGLHMPHESESV